MREVNFRGKVKYDDNNGFISGSWIEGFYGVKLNPLNGESQHYIMQPRYNPQSDSSYFVDVEVVPETVGECSGLPDKNGKKIFEGDIVKADNWNPSTGIIEFIEGGYCVVMNNDMTYPNDINIFYPSIGCQIEVIGNIHDNSK